MKREILFRAWDSKDNFMRYDIGELHFLQGGLKVIGCATNIGNGWVKDNPLMQSTGLKDKNDYPIFESDILKDLLSGAIWIVRFGFCKKFSYTGWYCEGVNVQRDCQINGENNSNVNSQIEIIGNIYENKELLNK